MDERYMNFRTKDLWSMERHWYTCRQVEIAWLKAMGEAGLIPTGVWYEVEQWSRIDVERIKELEAELGHDYNSFLDQLRESLSDHGEFRRKCGDYLHQPLTTMDGQDNALILRLRISTKFIIDALYDLKKAIWDQAVANKWSVCMGVTHNQDAEPTTLGVILFRHYDQLERSDRHLRAILDDDLAHGKMSGPVGTYGGIDPDVEMAALAHLGLGVARDATQIIQRDRHARLLNELAVIGAIIEQMAKGLWQRMGSRVRELEEPASSKKKASSAMPGKKNPNLDEQMWGAARMLRSYAGVAMENIATFQDRDISQSMPERLILPDATSLALYMLNRMTSIVGGLRVNQERMRYYVEEGSLGIWAGRPIRIALVDAGLTEDEAYRFVQKCSYEAVEREQHLRIILGANAGEVTKCDVAAILASANFFDAASFIKRGVEYIFSHYEPHLS